MQHERDLEQSGYLDVLMSRCKTVLAIFAQDMPPTLIRANDLLDQSERYFHERAFAPFWDNIEKATIEIADYDESVRKLSLNAIDYEEISKRYLGRPPTFPINARSMAGVCAIAPAREQLASLVRKAQRDFEFSTIYEQRKTNQLLIAGFETLAQALDGMGRRIESSIDDLSDHVSRISCSINSMNTTMTESLEEHSQLISSQNDQMIRVHEEALQMLDNIQRHRKPS